LSEELLDSIFDKLIAICEARSSSFTPLRDDLSFLTGLSGTAAALCAGLRSDRPAWWDLFALP
jgi:hypothetical protein